MVTPNFVIPLNREDLLSSVTPGQYYVQQLLPCNEISRRLADCSTALTEDGCLFILDHFDTIFSALHQGREMDTRSLLSTHKYILKGMAGMSHAVSELIENMDPYQREKLLNAGKMYLFLFLEIIRVLEERFNTKTDKNIAVDAKSRKKAIKNFVEFDWDEKRCESLIRLHDFIQQPLEKLWEPPVADEDFVNLCANCCYKILEDPQITQVRLSDLRNAIFDILGTLILRYSHGLSCTVKMVQLMKLYEHLPETLAQAALRFVREYQSRNFVREVIREITEAASGFENSSPKAYSHFLVEVAKSGPDIILPSMHMLLPELDSDMYMMRNCVLEVIGEIVSQSLAKEHLSDEQKEKRDSLLEHLEDHLTDTNGSVRSKVLKIWQRLCQERAIPLACLSQLLEHVVVRLEDISWSVTRNAVQLYKSLLQSNPFGDKLEIHNLRQKLQEEEGLLALMEKEATYQMPMTRTKKWEEMSSRIVLVLQEALALGDEEPDIPESWHNNSADDNVTQISRCLENEKYLDAYHLLRHLEKQSDFQGARNGKQLDWQVDHYLKLLRKIFIEFDEMSPNGNRKEERQALTREQKETQDKLMKQQTLTQYLKDCVVFAEQLETATEKINNLLFSAQPTVILDALDFLTAAFQFGLKGSLTGVQNMLMLVWSTENSVKEGVAASYKQLYISVAARAQGRSRASEIVKNLCSLLKTLNEDQQAALEVLVHQWVKDGDMDKECFQVMWERFSLKLPDTTEDESRAALILLAMVGGAEPNVLKTNIPVLISIGLGERSQKEKGLAKETCRALLKLVPEKTTPDFNEEPFRLEKDHNVFKILCSMLKDGFGAFEDGDYISMAYEAIDVIYQLSEHPERICVNLLKELENMTKNVTSSDTFDAMLNSNGNIGNEPQARAPQGNSNFKVPVKLLQRFVFFIGHIAYRQWIHLDKTVFRELKRRNRIRELDAEKRRGDKEKKKVIDKRKSVANLNSSLLSRASETPRMRKDKEESAADAEIGEINADDADVEYITHVCETEVVTGDSCITALSEVVIQVCTNPQTYSDSDLCSTASLALTKLMLVSSSFCEKHLPLVFTMMEKSEDPNIRSNLVYGVGDLVNRFPNVLEPWTTHLYGRLQDKSSQVRSDTIMVLKHLITNEMVKVRGQISDMALCIVDPEERISVMATEFFQVLSKKGNTLYNVMPDIISRLSNPTRNVSVQHFQAIFEFLLPLINKEKQMESLVDKLCQRFKTSTSERQWDDLGFCLSRIQFSDRSLRRLTENIACYSDKLSSPNVYAAFEVIISQALKVNKPERKVLVEELQAKIDEVLKRGLGNETITEQCEGAEEESVDADRSSQKENRLLQNKKERVARGRRVEAKKKNSKRRDRRKNRSDSSEETDEEESNEDEIPVHLTVRQRNRRSRR